MVDSISILPIPASAGTPMNCIVIDDEPIARRGMAFLASRHPSLNLEAVLSGPREALEWMESHSPDLVFLDIEMPGIKGMDLATHFPDNTMVVFTTAYSEYAARSYDLNAVDYLLKPIDSSKFDRAVQKALARSASMRGLNVARHSPTLTLRADRRFVNIDIDKIIFLEGVKDYVRLHTESGRIISRITIKALLERLPATNFIRIHKSYVINLARVEAYDTSTVILHSQHDSVHIELPIGAAFRANLIRTLKRDR